MSKPTISSLHERLQAAELRLGKIDQKVSQTGNQAGLSLSALIDAMRILWKLARLLEREDYCLDISDLASKVKAAFEPPRL